MKCEPPHAIVTSRFARGLSQLGVTFLHMSNKVTDALQRAAATVAPATGNFARGDVAPAPQQTISKADAAGLSAPPHSPEEMAGFGVDAALGRRYLAELEQFGLYQQAKRTIEKEHEDALWAAIQARATG
jgi:hypothetical protein